MSSDEPGVVVFWVFAFIVMVGLAFFAGVTIYRHLNAIERMKQLWRERGLCCFCILIEIITFSAYFADAWVIHEILWNVWIPCFTIALSLLSFNIVNIYLDTSNVVNQQNVKDTIYLKSLKSLRSLKRKISRKMKLSNVDDNNDNDNMDQNDTTSNNTTDNNTNDSKTNNNSSVTNQSNVVTVPIRVSSVEIPSPRSRDDVPSLDAAAVTASENSNNNSNNNNNNDRKNSGNMPNNNTKLFAKMSSFDDDSKQGQYKESSEFGYQSNDDDNDIKSMSYYTVSEKNIFDSPSTGPTDDDNNNKSNNNNNNNGGGIAAGDNGVFAIKKQTIGFESDDEIEINNNDDHNGARETEKETENETENGKKNSKKTKTRKQKEIEKLKKFREKMKIRVENVELRPSFWKWIWILWIGCSLSNWIGSILGWFFHYQIIQAFCYGLWKFIAFIMLLLCLFILINVRKRCLFVHLKRRNSSYNDDMSKKLADGIKRLRNLMICELCLAIFLFLGCIYETYVVINLAENHAAYNIYATSELASVGIYFPVWTFVHIILLVYTWIPNDKLEKNVKMMQNNNINNNNSSNSKNKRNSSKNSVNNNPNGNKSEARKTMTQP